MIPETPEQIMRRMEHRIRDLEVEVKRLKVAPTQAMTSAHIWMNGDTIQAEGTLNGAGPFIAVPIFPPDGMLISRIRTQARMVAAASGILRIGLYKLENPDVIQRVPQFTGTFWDLTLIMECNVVYNNGDEPNINTTIQNIKVDGFLPQAIRANLSEQYVVGFAASDDMTVPLAQGNFIAPGGFQQLDLPAPFALPQTTRVIAGITALHVTVLSPRGAAILGG